MADQCNMPVAAQRGPCEGSVLGGIGGAYTSMNAMRSANWIVWTMLQLTQHLPAEQSVGWTMPPQCVGPLKGGQYSVATLSPGDVG